MMIGRIMAAASVAVALGLALMMPTAASADEVTVKKDGTALTLGPSGKSPTAWKVNGGFPLTVVEQRGGWLKVESSRLPDEGQELWVRANQVAGAGPAAAPGALEKPTGFRIELTGTPGTKFKLQCWTTTDDHVSFRRHANTLPQTYEFAGDATACFVSKRSHYGVVEIGLSELYPSKERVIGTVTSLQYPVSLVARSRGAWGPAAVTTMRDGNLPPL